VADPDLVDACLAGGGRAGNGDLAALTPLVEAAVRGKAAGVGGDGGEGRPRRGEAVALGMVCAARVAEATGLAAAGLADGHVRVLGALGLPTGGVEFDPDAVVAAMATDKKHLGGLRLVLLRAVGEPVLVQAPAPEVLVAAVRSL